MQRLYRSLAPDGGLPRLLRDPLTPLTNRLRRVTLEPLTLSVTDSPPVGDNRLPVPQLQASVQRIHGTACAVLDAARFCFIPSSTDRHDVAWTFIQAEAQARAMVEEGFALALAGQVDTALAVWTRVLALPEVEWARALAANYIGIVHHRADRFDLAIAAYTQAVDLASASPSVQVTAATNCGAAHDGMGRPDLAIESFSRAIAISDDHPPAVSSDLAARALVFRGIMRERTGDPSGARDDFCRAVGLKELPLECRGLLARSAAWLAST
jgi:tetratricopeptide (TPR) repeat protein